MKPIKSLYYLEFKKLFSFWNLVTLFILFALLLGISQLGIIEYKKELSEIEISNKLEKLHGEQFERYQAYGAYGIKFYMMPCSLSFISGFKIYSSLVGTVDHGTKLNINESRKSPVILPDPAYGFLNFAGLLLLFGSLLVMTLGYTTFPNEKESRFLCSLKRFDRMFVVLITSRLIFITTALILLTLCSALMARLNGLTIPVPYFLVFFGLAVLVMNFYYFLGIFAGSLKTRIKRVVAFVGLFLALTILPLLVIVNLAKGVSNTISEYQTEYDKLRFYMAIERNGIKRFGNTRSGEEINQFIRSFIANELKIIEDMESKYKKELHDKVGMFQDLSCFFPALFYLSSANEISGGGYRSYFDFYGFIEKMKNEFIKFFFDKEYFSKVESGKVESFIKGDNNIFYCRPGLPPKFLFGIILTLLYTAILVFFSYRNIYRRVFPVHEKMDNEDDFYVEIARGNNNILFTDSELLKAKLYNHLSGKETLKGEIAIIPGLDTETGGAVEFTYIPGPEAFAGISPAILHCFLFGVEPERNMDTWDILLKFLLAQKIVIMDQFIKGTEPKRVKELAVWLSQTQLYCLIITNDYYMAKELVKDKHQLFIEKNDPTGKMLKDQVEKGI
ncbi:MAG: transporter permease subunit [Acidobacteriota bacterium]|nr:transporter permease subunit [Acidobacteriota bacterium]